MDETRHIEGQGKPGERRQCDQMRNGCVCCIDGESADDMNERDAGGSAKERGPAIAKVNEGA